MSKTLTKLVIAENISQELGLPLRVISEVICDIIEHICQSLIDEQEVKIARFGTFKCMIKGQRVGRNPKTGVEVVISSRKVVVFRASCVLKDAVKMSGG